MHSKTKRIVMTALMASLVCVATMLIKVPSPMNAQSRYQCMISHVISA